VVTSYAERNEGRDQAVAKTLAKRGDEAIVLRAPMRCYSFLAGIRKRFPDAAGHPLPRMISFDQVPRQAVAINNNSEVVGFSTTPSDNEHAFYWTQQTGLIDLGTLPGGSTSGIAGINDSGQIAGAGSTADGTTHAMAPEIAFAKFLPKGDVLMVTRIDRLACSIGPSGPGAPRSRKCPVWDSDF
jgi:probable HAF family extracellular repeat protein